MYGAGKGVTKDDAASAEWYPKAAEQNAVNSQRILGGLYAAGRGVPKDVVQAYAWSSVAAGSKAAAREQLTKLAGQMTEEQKAQAAKVAEEIAAQLAKLNRH